MRGDRYIRRIVIVEGPLGRPFPIDMLRYDHCVPATEEDAHLIERINRREHVVNGTAPAARSDHIALKLYRYVRIEENAPINQDTGKLLQSSRMRWASKYRWHVLSDKMED